MQCLVPGRIIPVIEITCSFAFTGCVVKLKYDENGVLFGAALSSSL